MFSSPKLSLHLFLWVISGLLIGCNTTQQSELSNNPLSSSSLWITTSVTDESGQDLTQQNKQFVGLAKYNADNTYEFFDLNNNPRGDQGYYFVLPDHSKRILVSTTKNYTRIADITNLTKDEFTYSVTTGEGKKVFVHHKLKG